MTRAAAQTGGPGAPFRPGQRVTLERPLDHHLARPGRERGLQEPRRVALPAARPLQQLQQAQFLLDLG